MKLETIKRIDNIATAGAIILIISYFIAAIFPTGWTILMVISLGATLFSTIAVIFNYKKNKRNA